MELIKNVWSLKEGKVAFALTVGGIVGAYVFSKMFDGTGLGTLLTIVSALISVYGGDMLSKVVMIVKRHMRGDDEDL